MEILVSHLFAFSLGVAVCNSPFQLIFKWKHASNRLYDLLMAIVSLLSFQSAKEKHLQSVQVELLDRYQVENKYDVHSWQRQGYEAFVGQLVSKTRTFPCIYGTKGYKANELDFLFLSSEDLGSHAVSSAVAKGLHEYHKCVETRGRNTSLVIMTPPPAAERSVDQYHKLFWSLLQRLRRLDPMPWPREIPADTAAERWCFNFEGISAFIAVLTPAHSKRQSRYAPNMCMVYQPRYIFDRLFTSEKNRASATATVRGLVDRYDGIPHSPDISDYARPGTTESRQYFLLDENVTAVCPYDSLDVEIAV